MNADKEGDRPRTGEPLTELEVAVLHKLLEEENPINLALRAQLPRATVSDRQLTGVGFFTHFGVPLDLVPAPVPSRWMLDGVGAHLHGLEWGAGFILWLKDGRLSSLEAYTHDEPWPDHVDGFVLRMVEPYDNPMH